MHLTIPSPVRSKTHRGFWRAALFAIAFFVVGGWAGSLWAVPGEAERFVPAPSAANAPQPVQSSLFLDLTKWKQRVEQAAAERSVTLEAAEFLPVSPSALPAISAELQSGISASGELRLREFHLRLTGDFFSTWSVYHRLAQYASAQFPTRLVVQAEPGVQRVLLESWTLVIAREGEDGLESSLEPDLASPSQMLSRRRDMQKFLATVRTERRNAALTVWMDRFLEAYREAIPAPSEVSLQRIELQKLLPASSTLGQADQWRLTLEIANAFGGEDSTDYLQALHEALARRNCDSIGDIVSLVACAGRLEDTEAAQRKLREASPFSPLGLRNPFGRSSRLPDSTSQLRRGPIPELERKALTLDQVRLLRVHRPFGLSLGASAVVLLPSGNRYRIGRGSLLTRYEGRLAEIESDRIVVTERIRPTGGHFELRATALLVEP